MKMREFGFLAGLAWKNLSRYRKRTVITALTIAVGIAIYIWVDAWLLGADKESFRNLIWYETASAKVLTTGYWEEREFLPLSYTVDDPAPIMERIERAGFRTAPRVAFSGELIVYEDPYPADGSLPVRLTAIDPLRDPEVFRLDEHVAEGRYLEPDDPGILLGAWLAEDIGAEVGYPITVATRTKDGGRTTMDLTVIGLLNTPNPIINRSSAYIPLRYADDSLFMDGSVTEITVHIPERADLDAATALIQEAAAGSGRQNGPTIVVKNWQELGSDYIQLSAMKSSGTSMILMLIFIIAAVGISNTMLMAVFERIREIGMMRAIGMKDTEIRITFMLEAAGIGLIGATAGLVLGTIFTWATVTWGIDFSFMTRSYDIGYRVAGAFRAAWHPAAMVQAFVFGVLASMAVAWVPAGKALKKGITECLRYQ